jgi:predicted amino acid racemase
VFVDVTTRRNPELIRAAVQLHHAGQIPSNCYVIDLDAVSRNAAGIARQADGLGLKLYQMTKQFGRNPVVAQAVARSGIPDVVSVDFEEARLLHRAGLRIGHLGHLVQIPGRDVAQAVAMRAELVTVFGLPQAARIAAAADAAGVHQDLLLRVVGADDTFYPGQRGGVPVEDVVGVARRIQEMKGVNVAGVTSFPCVLWDETSGRLVPTANLQTINTATQLLRTAGIETRVVNAPSATCSAILPMLAELGATHVEPGSSLIGQTPLHAVSDEPELPAMVYVSEISHLSGDTAYTLAGGLYPRSRAHTALVYDGPDSDAAEAVVRLEAPETIDYYGTLDVTASARRPQVGDTVVYAFRAQVFVSRAFVAVLSGVGSAPLVEGIFDRNGNLLSDDMLVASSR